MLVKRKPVFTNSTLDEVKPIHFYSATASFFFFSYLKILTIVMIIPIIWLKISVYKYSRGSFLHPGLNIISLNSFFQNGIVAQMSTNTPSFMGLEGSLGYSGYSHN
jgi:hypothetical protein